MNKDFYSIFEKVKQLSGVEKKSRESEEQMILRGLAVIEENSKKGKTQNDSNNERLNSILDVIMAVAQLDYSKKAKLSRNADHIDALAAGINMLGEEIKASTVSLHEKETL